MSKVKSVDEESKRCLWCMWCFTVKEKNMDIDTNSVVISVKVLLIMCCLQVSGEE